MLDIKFIRENLDIVKAGAKKKHVEVDLDRLVTVDEMRREALTVLEKNKAEQNRVSAVISTATDASHRNALIGEMKVLKEQIQRQEEELKTIMEEWQRLMLHVPQIPDMSVPDGDSDEDNVEVKAWGEQTKFDFPAKDHVEIMTALGMVDC